MYRGIRLVLPTANWDFKLLTEKPGRLNLYPRAFYSVNKKCIWLFQVAYLLFLQIVYFQKRDYLGQNF